MRKPCLLFLAAITFTSSMMDSHPAPAQDFYKDKVIRFIVGQAAGGGYDTYTRTIALHMIKHIPGHPAVTVENMTGAGSLVAANYLYNTAKPDGLTVANWNSAFVLSQALGDPNVRFDARKFGWIGAPSKGVPVCLIMGFSGPKTFDEILKSAKPIKMGGTAPGSHSIDLPLMLNKMLGTSSKSLAVILELRRLGLHCSGARWTASAPIGNRSFQLKGSCLTPKETRR
ncbi:MAG TPA: hypothetical protein VLJ79_10750 [Candidatus Binatia bacterium]|nr:hypothetical protein [Candidatus Binatia bacterium]